MEVISYLAERARARADGQNVWRRTQRRLCAAGVRVVAAFSDPVVRTTLGRRRLYAPLSHRQALFRAQHPYYDTAMPRLAAFVHRRVGELTLIDVGANIGDTVSLVTDQTPARCLAVEGDEEFFRLLRLNTAHMEDVVCERAVLSDAAGTVPGALRREGGTAHVVSGPGPGRTLAMTTVDALVRKHPAFSRADLLKVDTDGYDYKVLRGAEGLLRAARPALYFELSPWHLRTVGGEDPLSIFGFLRPLGYSRVLFYDNVGFPLACLETADVEMIAQLVGYAGRKRHFYFDVVALHPTDALEDFARSEREALPPFDWADDGLRR